MDGGQLTISVVGILGTLTGALVGPQWQAARAARLARDARLQDLQVTLYSDSALYVHKLGGLIASLLLGEDANRRWRGGDEGQPKDADSITARMIVLAPPEVMSSWKSVLERQDEFLWCLNEGYPEAAHEQYWCLPSDDPQLVKLQAEMERFEGVLRKHCVIGSAGL